ncbi:MAG: DegV family protein, partial [Chloroflexota bacterium]|nr:DegV family protein [Chloroflexota bacterium]
SIAIITDTDASLSPALAEEYGIRQAAINVHFGEKLYRTWTDINDSQLFTLIDAEGKLPTTSAPTPGQFAEVYQAAFADGADEVICFTVSEKISATYSAALTAKDLVPGKTITVVDTRQLSMAQGFMVLEAAKLAKNSCSREEIIDRALNVGERVHLFGALATLKYLAMSGRVGHLTAGMANILNIKPILSIQEGKLDLLEKVRTRHKAWERVVELTANTLNGKGLEQMAIIHVAAPEQAREFETFLREKLPCPPEILTAELTAGLSVHSGAGLVGVTVVTAE